MKEKKTKIAKSLSPTAPKQPIPPFPPKGFELKVRYPDPGDPLDDKLEKVIDIKLKSNVLQMELIQGHKVLETAAYKLGGGAIIIKEEKPQLKGKKPAVAKAKAPKKK